LEEKDEGSIMERRESRKRRLGRTRWRGEEEKAWKNNMK
jgi:hypothetical protein